MRKLLIAALCCSVSWAAWAGSSTVNYTSSGASPFRTTTDGSSNNIGQQTIWDATAGANGLSIDSSGRAATNMAAMGGTAIAAGCVAALNGLTSAIPSTVCPWMGVYVINAVASVTAGNGVTSTPTADQNGSSWSNKANFVSGAGSATGTAATTIISAPASNKLYITGAQCSRDDTGTTAIHVTFNDTASTTMILVNNGGGGGNNMPFLTPLVVAATTAFQFTSSASTTTVRCSAQGYNAS